MSRSFFLQSNRMHSCWRIKCDLVFSFFCIQPQFIIQPNNNKGRKGYLNSLFLNDSHIIFSDTGIYAGNCKNIKTYLYQQQSRNVSWLFLNLYLSTPVYFILFLYILNYNFERNCGNNGRGYVKNSTSWIERKTKQGNENKLVNQMCARK